jgi:hypothetical protein
MIDYFGNLIRIGYGKMKHGITGVPVIYLIKKHHEPDQNQRRDQGDLGYQAETLFQVNFLAQPLCILKRF